MGGKDPAPDELCKVISSGKFWFGNILPNCADRELVKAKQIRK